MGKGCSDSRQVREPRKEMLVTFTADYIEEGVRKFGMFEIRGFVDRSYVKSLEKF